ncbi:hypothetical protein [Bacillus wiedmannii]|uniref:hypothetical protein n=1 Tax=Bacillus wiedmannii TaxID=1890302 RepID=UPI002E1AA8BC|nr:hypothetical protein [Bacillus wiedmannii]
MLVELGKSIVTTHELFKRLDVETLDEIEQEGYILIMDEVANVLEAINISHKDIEYLLKWNVIEADELGKVTWLDIEYGQDKDDKFRDIKIIAENENLFILKEKMKELPKIKVIIENEPSAKVVKNIADYLKKVAQK